MTPRLHIHIVRHQAVARYYVPQDPTESIKQLTEPKPSAVYEIAQMYHLKDQKAENDRLTAHLQAEQEQTLLDGHYSQLCVGERVELTDQHFGVKQISLQGVFANRPNHPSDKMGRNYRSSGNSWNFDSTATLLSEAA